MAADTTMSMDREKLKMLMHLNHYVRDLLESNLNDFLTLRTDLLNNSGIRDLSAFNGVLSPLVEETRIEQLSTCIIPNRVQLVMCGENSSGKTAFLHTLLGIGKILPSGDGPVTGRITKLTYTSAEQAHVSIRKSFQDQTLLEPELNLATFFSGDKPDWMGVGRALSPHTKRPKDVDKASFEFAEWARGFVEVHIPSDVLALGVDVYDTPGFLLDDAPVLKEILHDLVARIHPTIVFMYANPSTDDATRGSFLAMKTALHDLGASNIFFLNSKVDIPKMPRFKKDMKIDEFLSVLADERAQRYRLLLRTPLLANDRLEGLPELVEQCECFDVCSVNSQVIKPYGPLMNSMTIKRLMKFITRSDLAVTKYICRLVLPIIDAFFALLRIIRCSTREHLLQLHVDATNWAVLCFQAYKDFTEKGLKDLFFDISERFKEQQESIIQLFANQRISPNFLELSLQVAVRLNIIKPAFHDTIKKFIGYIFEHIKANCDLTRGAVYNEILAAALGRQEVSDFAALLLGKHASEKAFSASILYMVNTFSIPIIQCAQNLHDLDFLEEAKEMPFAFVTKRTRSQIDKHVRENLLNIQQIIEDQRNNMEQAIKRWGDKQQAILKSLIDVHYNGTSPMIDTHQAILQHLEQYTPRFVIIECNLRAAQDMARFNDCTPKIRGEYLTSSMFSVFTADWGDETNLLVKRISQSSCNQSYGAYFEAHYHLKVANLHHANIIDIRYLYEHRLNNQNSELWIIFPSIPMTLEQYLQHPPVPVSIKMIVKWMIDIADALVALHRNELVHRNITLSNIVVSKENDAMLIDFCNWTEQYDLSVFHNSTSIPNGVINDMIAFGEVGQILSSSIERDDSKSAVVVMYTELMVLCSHASQEKPITAEFIREQLKFTLDMILT